LTKATLEAKPIQIQPFQKEKIIAKVLNNIITKGLSGALGDQIIFRTDKAGRTIVAVKPASGANRAFNGIQKAHQEAFRQATLYAKGAKDQVVYASRASGTPMNAYNVAVADWFNEPEVLEIDASNWSGKAGETQARQDHGRCAGNARDGGVQHRRLYVRLILAPPQPRKIVRAREHPNQHRWDRPLETASVCQKRR
jgi:hypothetical protein